MQIENKEEYKEIPTSALGLSPRSFNSLMRTGINTLYMLIEHYENLPEIRNMGAKSIKEITDVLKQISEDGIAAVPVINVQECDGEKNSQAGASVYSLPDDILDRPANDLHVSVRICNSFAYAGIKTIREVLKLTPSDIRHMKNMGRLSAEQLECEIELLKIQGADYFEQQQESEDSFDADKYEKGFDFDAIDILTERFYFKPMKMTEWFGLSRQGIYNVLDKRSPKRRIAWTGKEMTDREQSILAKMIGDKKFDYSDKEVICCCLNNRKDDLACLFIYEKEIKCFFLKDLPAFLKGKAISINYHKYTERELSGETEGRIVHVITKPYFLPAQPNRFRVNAQLRDMSPDDYAIFISGYPMCDSRSITDEHITAFFDNNLVDGKVYISSEAKNQWIRSLAYRNGYSITDFIELFGYEPKFGGTELTTDGARSRHVEALKKYVIHDNVVYFPTDSHIYRVLNTYSYNKSMELNEYIESLGYERTTERPEVKTDILEMDMQVRNILSDAKFEDKVFAHYPLLGSKILKPETLEKLNKHARTYIDTVLREPLTQLTTRAKMQIALALINNAKDWKNEENPNFWNYITLQFGYRDASGGVVRLLQSSLEAAMKKNNRLFIEDINGRAFKSTAVIHALSTKKSWMALFDFLFDFYKNNLNWKIISGDPLLELMVNTLQKKLAGDSEEDTELTISSRVYSFQEGIRKLILLRPVFSRNLFEKLIKKIDSMINSEEMPVKTYEEQLCEEWFKEKITAIANTKKTERQKVDIQREVAIDYSHIRVRYILKNENNLQVVLPDIRLRREDIQRAVFIVFYGEYVAFQQNLSWYGNELGKTLSGVSVTLPEYTGEEDDMRICIQIHCDNEVIFNSEETLYRRVLLFSGGNEVNVSQIHRDHYTLIIPETARLDVEKTDITEIDAFRTPGLKAYFLELYDGYVLTVNGKLLAFDSENGTDIRVISPSETAFLPHVTTAEAECYLAYRTSECTFILGNADYKHQFVIIKNGERIEFSDLEDAGNGVAFICPFSNEKNFCRLQVINMRDERLVFDRSFMLVSKADCAFDRDFYFVPADYENALFYAEIDDYYEEATFTGEDEEIQLPFRNGILHADIPRIRIQETTGEWLNGQASAWYVGNIPQNSLLRVNSPAGTSVKIFIGGKDIMYDNQGLVTLGNVIQSFVGLGEIGTEQIEMLISRNKSQQRYLLTRVCYKECFLNKPELWYSDGKLFWNRGGHFVGKAGRIFTLELFGDNETAFSFELNVNEESIFLPEDMPIGNYRFQISFLSGGLFKKQKEVLAEGDCIVGDPNLLRFNGRRIVIDAITDEFKEEAGHITIKTCYIDQPKFVGIEDTSEGLCPVYSGVLYTENSYGSRYEFSSDKHTNNKGITKMMVNPVRIVYVGNTALCITDSEGDGLYYYSYYDKYLRTIVHALTDREYTKTTRNQYSTADLYSYRTERIKDV